MTNAIRNIDDLSDYEIEDCIDGSSDVNLIRKIAIEWTMSDGFIDTDEFGHEFAMSISGFIDADEGTEVYDEAWSNNVEWGETIAENLNQALSIETPEEYKE